jgi:hypothetical protein
VSGKPVEEGWFWEWRTFGARPEHAARILEAQAVRGNAGLFSYDEYFIADRTDQNVKLRDPQLKLKPLLARLADGLELYEESARLLYDLPIDATGLSMAASLLGVEVSAPASATRDEVVRVLGSAAGVRFVPVHKRRTQYTIGEGWAELAEIEFPGGKTWSLGVQSRNLSTTRAIRDMLDPGREFVPMGYVEACRKWGGEP